MKLQSTVGALATLASILCATANAQPYSSFSAVDLGYVVAHGLNDFGQVVGWTESGQGIPAGQALPAGQAFLTGANGVGMTYLSNLGGIATYANSVNDAGQVVGASDNTAGYTQAFVTGANGVGITAIGPAVGNSSANGINNSGQVVGFFSPTQLTMSSFLANASGGALTVISSDSSDASAINNNGQVLGYSGSGLFITNINGSGSTTMTMLQLGAVSNLPNKINGAGQVTGNAYTNGNSIAWLTGPNGAGQTYLGTLGGNSSTSNGLNDAGRVVGYSYLADGTMRAFVTGNNGTGMVDLNTMLNQSENFYLEDAEGINNSGEIIANASNGQSYLLIPSMDPAVPPIPEPSAYVMVMAGIGVLYLIRRSQQTI